MEKIYISVDNNKDVVLGSVPKLFLTLEALAPYVGGLGKWPQNSTSTNAASYKISNTDARLIECYRNGAQTVEMPTQNGGWENGSLWFIVKGGQYTGDVTINKDLGGGLLYTLAPGGWAVIASFGPDASRWRVIASGV